MKIVIEPGRGAAHYWRDLWQYRELLYFLAWRDIAVRYKQTAIGVAWALIRPAVTMLVFVLFRRLIGIERGAVPDVLFVLAAVLAWQFFATALSDTSNSLINNTNLVSKVYFPRLIVPIAAVVTALADFVITFALLVAVMAWVGFAPSATLLLLPAWVVLLAGLSLGVGALLAALNVEYRDFRYIVPFVIQVGLFISPIAFASANMPQRWRPLYALNPLVGIIDGFRWSILGGRTPIEPVYLSTSITITAASLLFGVWYFRRMERGFADVI
ncbi:MAG TPA: ABC transporter permease [Vicinamibacterales bacterium]|nr:ABC transporter permease [Vicinamibacterales bacterium]